jgi:hypothetical protein
MTMNDLREALRLVPFRPFRVFVTDGGTYDVRHPDLCMIGPRIAVIGIPPAGQNEPILERFAVVDLIHVTRLEPIDGPSSPTSNGESAT